MLNIINEKNLLREKSKKFRKSLGANEKKKKDEIIFKKLISSQEFISAENILCYYSTCYEVETLKIINYSLKVGKRVALPVCIDKSGLMQFRFISTIDELSEGAYGLKEPINSNDVYTNEVNSICIIPALLVDENLVRLGYGKGYYDRFLSEFAGCKCVLCYKENIVEKLPVFNDFDVKCDICITD